MRFRRIRFLAVPLLAGIVLVGCKPPAAAPWDRVPPNPNAPARYGPPTGLASKDIARALPHSRDTTWQSAPFYVLHTELSPAILVHSSTRYLGLFEGLAEQGLGAPSHVAWSSRDGPRAFKAGDTLDASGMEENWVLVWFAGATNWTNWDSPWAVFLQHKPAWLRLDERGLHLEFPASAGDVVMMPLYGYFKLPPAGRDYLAEHGLKSRKLYSWEWEKVLARDPLTRLRFWSGASREFPIYCEDSFSVDRARDELTIRSRFEWHSIDDDWKTKHVKLAPISPALGLAALDKGFPVRFSKPFFDMELPTPFGPYLGIADVDSFDATFPVLHYVNEVEAFQAADTNAHPSVALALEKLQEYIGTNPPFTRIPLTAFGFPPELPQPTLFGVDSLAKALPFLEQPLRVSLTIRLKEFLMTKSMNDGAFQALWAYGHWTEDWQTVRLVLMRWKDLIHFRPASAWAGFAGVMPTVGQPDECASLARIAYRVGDLDLYYYACLQFVHDVAHLWEWPRNVDYLQKQFPGYSMEWIKNPIVSTNGRALLINFNRFAAVRDPGVARFYRDFLREDTRLELDWIRQCWGRDDRLRVLIPPRALLLSETPAQLASFATPDRFSDWPDGLLAVLRASRPARIERLIPPGNPSPFVAGLEREIREASPALVTGVEWAGGRAWPRLVWPAWKSPRGGPWSFGRIKPVRDGDPASMKRAPLNWNTEILTYALP